MNHFIVGGYRNGTAILEIVRHHGILLSNQKERTIDTCKNLNEPLENYAEFKKSIPKVI